MLVEVKDKREVLAAYLKGRQIFGIQDKEAIGRSCYAAVDVTQRLDELLGENTRLLVEGMEEKQDESDKQDTDLKPDGSDKQGTELEETFERWRKVKKKIDARKRDKAEAPAEKKTKTERTKADEEQDKPKEEWERRGRMPIDEGKIKALHEAKWTNKQIADDMGISATTVGKYLKKLCGGEEK